MDAFFAAIEVLDNPSLRGKPVIVGGSTSRGVVSTASYEARKFGVHSAMPIFKAKEKCPDGIFLPVRMERYKDVSKRIMDIVKEFTPLVEPVSVDEAYLDITGSEGLLGSPEEIAGHIKDRIGKETGLTCSIGIAPNRFLAKVASDMNKPDGLTIVSADEVDTLLSGLPVEKIPGVGKRTLESLRHHGVKTAGDLKTLSKEQLIRWFGRFGSRLHELATGRDDSEVVPEREIKSLSSEETLPSDTKDTAHLTELLRFHADKVAWRLRREGLKGRTITLKIKFDDFSEMSKSRTSDYPTDSTKVIVDSATELLLNHPLRRKVRLIGIAVSKLRESKGRYQMDLFRDWRAQEKERRVDETMDEIKRRFGKKMIRKGRE